MVNSQGLHCWLDGVDRRVVDGCIFLWMYEMAVCVSVLGSFCFLNLGSLHA